MRRVYLLTVLLPIAFSQDAKKDPDQIGTRDVSKGVNFYSIEKEMALGKQLSLQLEKQHKLIVDKLITEYVNRLGQNLARHSDTKIPLTVKVVEGEDPNAITLPGGYIYVQTELIRTADTEAQLAAAMAHEIAHVAARHGTRQATKEDITQIATIPLIFMGGWPGICVRGASSLAPMGFLAAQRANEAEADLLGLEYLYKTGYDPLGMVEIFEKVFSLDDRKHGKLANLVSTHPGADNRLVNVQKNIEALLKAQPQYIVTTSEFANVKARLLALDWDRKPEPAGPKPPTLRRPGDQLGNPKKTVLETDARASQIKEAYTKW
ncbi:MAG TPA: M48 family metallopeptidase [Bryobacteraceae bacterium]|jgi:predicted Zn-dependent protease|nr:M48 family metallopeptidase [Bryobacteraceae bacterium]